MKNMIFAAALSSLWLAGCATSSLQQSRSDRRFPGEGALPVFVAVTAIEDPVSADDTALYLRDYWMRHRAVMDVELVPEWVSANSLDADWLLSGSIYLRKRDDSRSGWGAFASVITLGCYYLLGGPTRRTEAVVDYRFSAVNIAAGTTTQFVFQDQRKGYYGLYGPRSARNIKPYVYEPGWREVYFQLADHVRGDIP